MTESELAAIAARATPLQERLRPGSPPTGRAADGEQSVIEERLQRWCQTAAGGDWDVFHKRLRWDGLSVDSARAALGSSASAGRSGLPPWAGALRDIIATVREHADPSSLRGLDLPQSPGEPLPFEDALLPLLPKARRDLLESLGTACSDANCVFHPLLARGACRDLERGLLQLLTELCADALDAEFSAFRPFGYGVQGLMTSDASGPAGRTHYDAFIRRNLQTGLLSLFGKYPVLGRLTAVAVASWVESIAEFIQRLETDLPRIVEVFGDLVPSSNGHHQRGGLMGQVVAISPSLSDPHHGGRSVMAIRFGSGLRLVYKPRDLGPEEALQRLLDWCNRNGASSPFRTVRVLNQRTHGWMEFVAQRPCADASAARRFYRRAGGLLALLYPFGASDCHRENLVASGDHPVLIDAEVLLNQEATLWGEPPAGGAESAGHQQLWDSVLRTGLLPRWQLSPDGRVAYDISGLGSVEPQPAPTPMPRWQAINTDDMHRVHEPFVMPALENVPTLHGQPLRPDEYVDEVVAGFQELYRVLIERRDDLLNSSELMPALRACRPRFLVRDTQVYGVVLRQALAPTCLRNGADRGIELEVLGRAFLTAADRPPAWPLLRAELAALERMDIPYFASAVESDALTGELEQPLGHFFQRSAYDQLRERLLRLNATDLPRQCRIIRDTFLARGARPRADFPASRPLPEMELEARPFDRERLAREASVIADGIRERACLGADGSASWIDLQLLATSGRFQLQPLGASLYDGCGGVALFLAAYERVTGDSRFRELVGGALQSLRAVLRSSDATRSGRAARQLGLGGATGLGSIVYALVRTARFLGDDELLEDARLAAGLITPELVAADEHLDVLSGSAGAVLGLLALHAETPDATVLDRAVLCGRHLLERAVETGVGGRAWETMAQRPPTGFSHGAAGIAYALLRLNAATSDARFLTAAREGIAYEGAVFSPAAGNWPDFRPAVPGSEPSFVVRWCHGAAGIGLARLGGLTMLDTPEVRQDLEVALTATENCDWRDVDHLCCGNFGRIELLLEAGRRLGRPELTESAAYRASWVVARAQRLGAYRLHRDLPDEPYSPGLFRGTAGIGYQLLRLMAPGTLPSALLLE